jgi:hypothetical protein
VHFYHEFHAILPVICTKEEQQVPIHILWAEGVAGASMHKGYQYSMGTVLCHNKVYDGLRGLKIVTQVLNMWKEPNQQENGACMDCHRAQNFSFWGHKVDCMTMDPMHQ